MSFFPLPISMTGLIIVLALIYGAWLLIKSMNLVAKASNMSRGSMFMVVKIALVMMLVAIIVARTT